MNNKIYYKAFNRDKTCRGFKYEEGQTYEIDRKPRICGEGFHFCKHLVLTLDYYPVQSCITENLYAEVEALGDTDWDMPTMHKGCTNKIRIVRFIPDAEVKAMIDGKQKSGSWNSGSWNSGDWNSGSRNSGSWNSGSSNSGSSNSGSSNSGSRNSGSSNSGSSNSGSWNSGSRNSGDWNSGSNNSGSWNSGIWNSGNRNSGNWNSGNRNSGNWNSCDYETGAFNTVQTEMIRVFNKPCDRRIWESSKKPDFLYFGIDKSLGYKGSFQKSFESASADDIAMLKALPNFDSDVFFEISGIRV